MKEFDESEVLSVVKSIVDTSNNAVSISNQFSQQFSQEAKQLILNQNTAVVDLSGIVETLVECLKSQLNNVERLKHELKVEKLINDGRFSEN